MSEEIGRPLALTTDGEATGLEEPGAAVRSPAAAEAEIRRLEATVALLREELEARRREVAELHTLLRETRTRRGHPHGHRQRVQGAAATAARASSQAMREGWSVVHGLAHDLERDRPWWWLPTWRRTRRTPGQRP